MAGARRDDAVGKWRSRAGELAQRGLRVAAVAPVYRQRALIVLRYVEALVEAPSNIVEAERHLLAHLLHFPGSP